MTTIFEFTDWLDDNKDRILLIHSIGEDLVKKLDDNGVKYTVSDNGSVTFENCPEYLLEEIRKAKK
ncbi:hypothetical protein HDF24_15025 [Mucilaginibacter sp. X4EP1]|jgi:hypothetical protein|uniref:hypothetical protein n=1 Tax=Mucilaginibacter sp. X4EP1 TaxID=2723092 RepID=UPI0021696906|nr:hypothetical protein [Mucilaginibacter sp. X4EP1]MCS3815392.1 hypothetical protein [Mucilaginibacter sp. X4EP1]